MTYKLVKTIYDPDMKNNIYVINHVTLHEGLTWQKAKELRAKDRPLQIVKES